MTPLIASFVIGAIGGGAAMFVALLLSEAFRADDDDLD
jgi:hypothetical protein